jgi:hypothetical protein
MSATAVEILAAFREGAMSAEEAARQLLPLLQTSGKLNLELGPEVRPVLEALRRLASSGQPTDAEPLPPLAWESPLWRRLARVPDDLWTILRDRRLDQAPQCLRYVFTVRSIDAARTLEQWIADHSDHDVNVDLPASFQRSSGQLACKTRPKLLTKADLLAWVTWLQAIPAVPDAALTDLGIQTPATPG